MVTTVMLVDDHQLMREVLTHLLSDETDLEVVGAAPDALHAMTLATELHPDVVVMDIDLPGTDGIAATRSLRGLLPSVRVLMLSASCSQVLVRDSMHAGASGYLLKGDPVHTLSDGVRAAARGEQPMAPLAAALWQ